MASGFPGGGGGGGGLPGLYGEVGRSIGGVQIGNSLIGNPSGNHNMAMYRFQQQQQQQQMVSGGGGITTDQSQIGGRRPESTTMIGKRSLAQFQSSYNTPQSSSSQTNFLLQQRQQQQQLAFLQQQQQQGRQQQQGQQQQQFMSSAASLLRPNPHQAQLLQQQQHQGLGMGMTTGSFLRSVKQRTTATNSYHNHHNTLSPISPLSPSIDLCSPNPNLVNHNNNNSNNNNNNNTSSINLSHHHQDPATASCLSSLSSTSSSSSAARLGVPLYHHHSHQLRLNQANTSTPATINNNNNNHAGSVVNFGSNQGPSPPPTIGYSNLCPNRPGSDGPMKPDPDNNNTGKKAIMSLEDLEKELLGDDDDDDDFDGLLIGSGDGTEGDAVSVITNSDWSDTFQLLSPNTPQTNNNSSITNTPIITTPPPPKPATTTTPTNNNTQISPSPTSSSSSSCSSSATPPPPSTPNVSVSAKQLISEAVTAISEGKTDDSAEILNRLSHISNQKGTPEQKLAFYMLHALRCRISPTEYPPPVTELFSSEHAASFQSLCDLSPCFKFPLLAANLAILDTIAFTLQENRTQDPALTAAGTGVITKTRVHIIDFDIGGGDQYTHLISELPSSQVHSLELRITAVDVDGNGGDRKNKSLEVVKETLIKLAERTGLLSFRFDSVVCGITELTRDSLGCEENETLVVNFAYRLFRVPDESVSMENLRDDLLRRVKGMCPRLVTLVEQEMNVNTASFTTRVSECGAYYAEVIDSLAAGGSRGDAVVVVEEGLGRKAANMVACEGRERVERCEVFGKWRARMGMAGFQGRRLTVGNGGDGQNVAESMRVKLCDPGRSGNPKFMVKEDGLGVCFGWNGRTLTVASAWR